jgi:hypothetical protein
MLGKLARLLESRVDEFATAEIAHNGKTLFDSDFDVQPGRLARLTGFDPAISALTGR